MNSCIATVQGIAAVNYSLYLIAAGERCLIHYVEGYTHFVSLSFYGYTGLCSPQELVPVPHHLRLVCRSFRVEPGKISSLFLHACI